MGGIAGMVHFKKNFIAYKSYNTLLVQDMADSLSPCGPFTGEWVGEHAALACRYAGGTQGQPLSRIVGGYEFVLVLDGVLYDTSGIRRELQRFGYQFDTGDDAELLLYAYIHYGAECARLLDGIYAFCIWDSMRQRIFVCRDRAGIKPLYYLYQDGNFLFGSAIKALFRHPSVSPQIDADSLRAVFSAGRLWPQGGIFAGVEELLPGHFLILDRSGQYARPYWEIPVRETTESAEELARQLAQLFRENIRRDMAGEVPSVILTGRRGSNLLAAAAAQETKQRLMTCSFELKNGGRYYKPPTLKNGSDRLYIERMIEELDSCHQYCSGSVAELNRLLPEVTAVLDMPGMAFDDAAMLCFFRELAKEHPKILSDAGFDVLYAPGLPRVSPDTTIAELLLPAVAETLNLAGYAPPASQYPMPRLTPRIARISRLAGEIEIRLPFCSRTILEYAYHIPEDMREDVFQKVAALFLSPDVAAHQSVPEACVSSAYYAEVLKNDVQAVLEDSRAPALAFFDSTAVRNLTEKLHENSESGDGLIAAEQLGRFLQINNWLSLYKPKLI